MFPLHEEDRAWAREKKKPQISKTDTLSLERPGVSNLPTGRGVGSFFCGRKRKFTSGAPQTRRGAAQSNQAARCPPAPESPPTCGRGSGGRGLPHRTSSGRAGSSRRAEEDVLWSTQSEVRVERNQLTLELIQQNDWCESIRLFLCFHNFVLWRKKKSAAFM